MLAAACGVLPLASPAPSAQPNQPSSVTGERNGMVIELVIDRTQVVPGDLVRAHVRLTNRGPLMIQREGNTCGSGPASVSVVSGAGFGEGREWDGIAGEFKRLLLEEAGATEGGSVIGSFWDAAMVVRNEGPGIPIACTAASMPQDFGPGSSDEATLAWRAVAPEGAILKPGPAVVRATFMSLSEGGAPPAFSFSVEAPIEIIGAEPGEQLTLADFADIALANEEFATWLEGTPRARWINTHFITWPHDGNYPPRPPYDQLNRRPVAEVGLFAEVRGDSYAGVIIDLESGEVLATRFE